MPLAGGAGSAKQVFRWSAGAQGQGRRASKNLRVALGSPIIIIRRLLKFDVKPVVVDEIYLPGEMFQGLTLEILQEWEGSLYSLFERHVSVSYMVRAHESIRAVAKQSGELPKLHGRSARVHRRLLSVERVAYTYGDKPQWEWRRGL